MRRLLLKLLLACSPLLFIIAVYFIKDPFKVLYHYDSFFPQNGAQPVVLNKDYATTETLINNLKKYNYDSYIFGNSRSMFYPVEAWEKHINATKCFHFDANAESLYGMERKLVFLHNRGSQIKNALIVMDQGLCSEVANSEGHLFKKHPSLSNQSKIDFQICFLKAFFDVAFLRYYLNYLATHKVSGEAVTKMMLNVTPYSYDATTNEFSNTQYEDLIKRNKDSFYTKRRLSLFYKRSLTQAYAPVTIKQTQIKMLENMKNILDENKTNYKIVISPLYNQVKFNPTDLATINSIFGKDNVFDFSGINNFTEDIYNYYEISHYRPHVAIKIMDSIYSKK